MLWIISTSSWLDWVKKRSLRFSEAWQYKPEAQERKRVVRPRKRTTFLLLSAKDPAVAQMNHLLALRACTLRSLTKRRVAEDAEFLFEHFLSVLRVSAFQNSVFIRIRCSAACELRKNQTRVHRHGKRRFTLCQRDR